MDVGAKEQRNWSLPGGGVAHRSSDRGDVYGKLLVRRMEILQCGLVTIETYLGWIVTGKMQSRQKVTSMTALTMFAQSEPVNILWELDVLGIQDHQCKERKEEREREISASVLSRVCASERGGPV
jgi:hypothetical protein